MCWIRYGGFQVWCQRPEILLAFWPGPLVFLSCFQDIFLAKLLVQRSSPIPGTDLCLSQRAREGMLVCISHMCKNDASARMESRSEFASENQRMMARDEVSQ